MQCLFLMAQQPENAFTMELLMDDTAIHALISMAKVCGAPAPLAATAPCYLNSVARPVAPSQDIPRDAWTSAGDGLLLRWRRYVTPLPLSRDDMVARAVQSMWDPRFAVRPRNQLYFDSMRAEVVRTRELAQRREEDAASDDGDDDGDRGDGGSGSGSGGARAASLRSRLGRPAMAGAGASADAATGAPTPAVVDRIRRAIADSEAVAVPELPMERPRYSADAICLTPATRREVVQERDAAVLLWWALTFTPLPDAGVAAASQPLLPDGSRTTFTGITLAARLAQHPDALPSLLHNLTSCCGVEDVLIYTLLILKRIAELPTARAFIATHHRAFQYVAELYPSRAAPDLLPLLGMDPAMYAAGAPAGGMGAMAAAPAPATTHILPLGAGPASGHYPTTALSYAAAPAAPAAAPAAAGPAAAMAFWANPQQGARLATLR